MVETALKAQMRISNLGIYVSVPFCRAKCSFCNFASGVSSSVAVSAYVERLCQEIDASTTAASKINAHLPCAVDTIYFGGGTPSLLEPAQLELIFGALHRNFSIEPDAEITIEAAPTQIADDFLRTAQDCGVNRISLGVQSFVDRESAAVGRTHTERECVREIFRLQAAGFTNVGADLIAGLPYQTDATWCHSLGVATSIGLNHLSIYMLEVDDQSRLGREVLAGGRRFHADGISSEDQSAHLYEAACDWLPTHGFPQYEISNFAPAAFQCQHNRKYWRRDPYLGFGLDAHSMLLNSDGAVRSSNASKLSQYTLGQNPRLHTSIGERETFEETIFLGLRMNQGLDVLRLRTDFRSDLVAPAVDAAIDLIRDGLMIERDGYWQLTLRGRLLSNDVFTSLILGSAV